MCHLQIIFLATQSNTTTLSGKLSFFIWQRRKNYPFGHCFEKFPYSLVSDANFELG